MNPCCIQCSPGIQCALIFFSLTVTVFAESAASSTADIDRVSFPDPNPRSLRVGSGNEPRLSRDAAFNYLTMHTCLQFDFWGKILSLRIFVNSSKLSTFQYKQVKYSIIYTN